MNANRRILSVAATIACLAIASPAFAQAYIGGSNQPAVQVDLGALDSLPNTGNGGGYRPPRQRSTGSPHYRSNRIVSGGDFQTVVIGGEGGGLAEVTPLATPVSYNCLAPPRHRAKHYILASLTAPRPPAHHHAAKLAHVVPAVYIPAGPSTGELNRQQLIASARGLPPAGVQQVRDVQAVPSSQPMMLDGSSSLPPSDAPVPQPVNQVALPPIRSDEDDVIEPKRQVPPPAPRPVPIVGPPPVIKGDDMGDTDTGAAPPSPITDTGPSPQSRTGYYNIPSKIMLSPPPAVQPPAPVQTTLPLPFEPVAPPVPRAQAAVKPVIKAPPVELPVVAPPEPVQPPAPAISTPPASDMILDGAPGTAEVPVQTALPLPAPPAAQAPRPPASVQAAPLPPPAPVVPIKATPVPSAPKPKDVPAVAPAPEVSPSDGLGICFAAASSAISPEARAGIDQLTARLKHYPDLRVALRSIASGVPSAARRLSLMRALAVKSALTDSGIAEDRIDVRALGAPPGMGDIDRVDFFITR